MENNLKSLLSAENIQVLVADDMAVIKGGGGKGKGHGRGGSGSGSGKGRGRGGSSSGKGRGHGGHGHGGNCGWNRCRPRKRC